MTKTTTYAKTEIKIGVKKDKLSSTTTYHMPKGGFSFGSKNK